MSKRIFLVTGANKGIGFEVTKQLAAQGHRVYLGARKVEEGRKAAEKLKASGDVRFLHLDINNTDSHKKAAEQIKSESGQLDGLINNAGIGGDHALPTTATLESLRSVFETNYFGTVMVTQAMLPLLRAGKNKIIVNVSSGLGSTTLHGDPSWPYASVNSLAYNSSKAALNHFTVLLAKELRGDGFKVNSISPGWVATDLGGANAPGKVEDGAQIILKCALDHADGPTGLFLTTGGIHAW